MPVPANPKRCGKRGRPEGATPFIDQNSGWSDGGFLTSMSIEPGMRSRLRNMTRNTGYVTIAVTRDGRAIYLASVVKEIENAPARMRLVRFGDTRTATSRRVQWSALAERICGHTHVFCTESHVYLCCRGEHTEKQTSKGFRGLDQTARSACSAILVKRVRNGVSERTAGS